MAGADHRLSSSIDIQFEIPAMVTAANRFIYHIGGLLHSVYCFATVTLRASEKSIRNAVVLRQYFNMGVSFTYLGRVFIKSTITAVLLAFVVNFVHTTYPDTGFGKLQPNCNIKPDGFQSFDEFYPYYLCEHSLPITKFFHFVATFNAAIFLLLLINNGGSPKILSFALCQAYGLAWISHFWLEQNKPATFKYPVFSFMSDWVMFKDAILGRVALF